MAYIRNRPDKNGKKHYFVETDIAGFPSQHATFEKLKDAKEWSVNREAELRSKRYHHNGTDKKRTVGMLIDEYIDKILYTKTTKRRYADGQYQQLLWWKKQIGTYRLDQLNQYLINEKKDYLRKNRTPATVPISCYFKPCIDRCR